ncbi:hypothetical protein Sjap_025798 [Stephania japonica]|uniref:Uncharacterized protein n=1 Tax=Stephania japonica TaxID=461633 RepID=A0AAP0E5U6_9MAGN
MDLIKVEDQNKDQEVPLLSSDHTIIKLRDTAEQNFVQKAMNQTFKSTAHLANLLPTGTVLAFHLLAPIFTNQGHCDPISRSMASALVALCGLSCFLLCFTDSIRDGSGNVIYGVATLRGLWIIDGSVCVLPELREAYRLKFMDFLHAFMSVLVFAAVALFDQNVVDCFYPAPSEQAKEVLSSLPVGVGVMCSMFFVTFPSKRHGIGFPLSVN